MGWFFRSQAAHGTVLPSFSSPPSLLSMLLPEEESASVLLLTHCLESLARRNPGVRASGREARSLHLSCWLDVTWLKAAALCPSRSTRQL